MASLVPLWPCLAFVGIVGKLDAVRQQLCWPLQGTEEVHLAFWPRAPGRQGPSRVMILPRLTRISDDRYPNLAAQPQGKQYRQVCDLVRQNHPDLSKRR